MTDLWYLLNITSVYPFPANIKLTSCTLNEAVIPNMRYHLSFGVGKGRFHGQEEAALFSQTYWNVLMRAFQSMSAANLYELLQS